MLAAGDFKVNCRRVCHLLDAYIDGEVNRFDRISIREHLKNCPDCQREYDSIMETKNIMSSLPVINPREDFEEDLISNLKLDQPAYASCSYLYKWAGYFEQPKMKLRLSIAAATVSVALAIVSIYTHLPSNTPQIGPMAANLTPTSIDRPILVMPKDYLYIHRPYDWDNSLPVFNGPSISPADSVTIQQNTTFPRFR
jgi:hypothetical protein